MIRDIRAIKGVSLLLAVNFLGFVNRAIETQRARGKQMVYTWRLMGLVTSLGVLTALSTEGSIHWRHGNGGLKMAVTWKG